MIIIGLLSINWLSEQLWQQFVTEENQTSHQWSHLEKIAKILPLLSDKNSVSKEAIFTQLSQDLHVSIIAAPMNEYSWLDEQKAALLSGNVVQNFDENGRVIFYVKSQYTPIVYQLAPFNKAEPKDNYFQNLKWFFLTISYLLLAGIIALWTRPLWRDLNQLTNMASDIADGKLNVVINTNKHSPIKSIVITFKDMAHRIIRLLSDQKQLVNAVSHELRTPLSRLRFSLAMLEGANEEQRKDMIKDVSEIEALIDEMLGYARLENINQDIQKSSIDLSALISNQVNKLNRLSDIKIEWLKPSPYYYQCNEHLLDRAIQNLSTNALKYANSKMKISLVVTKHNIKIIVEDDGKGISTLDREKVFAPFFRLESHRNRSENQQKGGYGLGLAIVQRICDWHKASCKLTESKIGGCCFIIELPINDHN